MNVDDRSRLRTVGRFLLLHRLKVQIDFAVVSLDARQPRVREVGLDRSLRTIGFCAGNKAFAVKPAKNCQQLAVRELLAAVDRVPIREVSILRERSRRIVRVPGVQPPQHTHSTSSHADRLAVPFLCGPIGLRTAFRRNPDLRTRGFDRLRNIPVIPTLNCLNPALSYQILHIVSGHHASRRPCDERSQFFVEIVGQDGVCTLGLISQPVKQPHPSDRVFCCALFRSPRIVAH